MIEIEVDNNKILKEVLKEVQVQNNLVLIEIDLKF